MNTVAFVLASLFGTVTVFLVLTLILRSFVFGKELSRDPDSDQFGTRSERIDNIHRQSERVHQVFEFYLKATLAILAGYAFILTTNTTQGLAVRLLLEAAGWLQFGIGAAFSFIVFLHLRSKVHRWTHRYRYWEPLLWMECWFFSVMNTVGICMVYQITPAILRVIPDGA